MFVLHVENSSNYLLSCFVHLHPEQCYLVYYLYSPKFYCLHSSLTKEKENIEEEETRINIIL